MIIFVQFEDEIASKWGGKSTDIAICLEKILKVEPEQIPLLKSTLESLSSQKFVNWLESETKRRVVFKNLSGSEDANP